MRGWLLNKKTKWFDLCFKELELHKCRKKWNQSVGGLGDIERSQEEQINFCDNDLGQGEWWPEGNNNKEQGRYTIGGRTDRL